MNLNKKFLIMSFALFGMLYNTPSNAQFFCQACEAGTFANEIDAESCEPCKVGSYALGAANTECTLCKAGTFAETEGTAECTPCSKGTAQSLTGQAACNQCASGTYADKEGLTECKTCDAGYICPDPGMTTKTKCIAGTYSKEGWVSCGSCKTDFGANYYSPLDGASECLECTAGKEINSINTGCATCTAGTYSSDGLKCNSCSAGQISAAGASSCTPCGAGKIANSNKSACSNCPAGHSSTANSDAPCFRCGENQWAVPGEACRAAIWGSSPLDLNLNFWSPTTTNLSAGYYKVISKGGQGGAGGDNCTGGNKYSRTAYGSPGSKASEVTDYFYLDKETSINVTMGRGGTAGTDGNHAGRHDNKTYATSGGPGGSSYVTVNGVRYGLSSGGSGGGTSFNYGISTENGCRDSNYPTPENGYIMIYKGN